MDAILIIAPVPAIVGIVELAKKLGLPTKFAPILSVAFGFLIAIGSAYAEGTFNTYHTLMLGLTYGLTAAGLYSGVKATVENNV